MAAGGHDGDDSFDALSDDLLRKIISLLPVTDAARSTALGPRWRHLWHSIPIDLDDTQLPEPRRAAAVDCVLSGHPGPFRFVRLLNCSFDPQDDQDLGRWLRLLAAKGTQQLFLSNQHGQPSLCLPADFFPCSSLRVLALILCTFPDDYQPGIFPNLKMLCISSVRRMTDQDLDHMLAASPVLEILSLMGNGTPQHIHLRSQSLHCVLLGCCIMEVFAVVDVPLLRRLFLSDLRCAIGRHYVRVRIACAPNLRVLGYLDPRVHELQIGDTVIKPNTMESPSTVVLGVKTLALKVNFGVLGQAKMLVSFLRCFPDVETLHIESVLHGPSVTTDESTPDHHADFWQKVSTVKCLRSRVKKMVLHKFPGDPNEIEFLKFIAWDARQLQSLLVLPHEEITISSTDKADEMIDKFECPHFGAWASRVLLVLPGTENVLRSSKAFDITVDDPFL